MFLSEVKKKFPGFRVGSITEGNRVGYWCPQCKKPLPIDSSEISWYYSNGFATGRHICGVLVESIWRD